MVFAQALMMSHIPRHRVHLCLVGLSVPSNTEGLVSAGHEFPQHWKLALMAMKLATISPPLHDPSAGAQQHRNDALINTSVGIWDAPVTTRRRIIRQQH
jgi:hypothetical protein